MKGSQNPDINVNQYDMSNMSPKKIRLVVAYDGTDYHGWQKQPSGTSIQDELERVLSKILNQEIKTVGSGRTDSGVHALEQNVHFELGNELTHPDLLYAVNRLLPRQIRVQRAEFAPKNFHAQISSTSKLYRYRILQSKVLCPLRRQYVWWPAHMLDATRLNQLAETIVGEHDFKAFQSTGTKVSSTIRKIHRAEWLANQSPQKDELVFEIEGEGFLKQMVRNLVGAMVDLSQKAENPLERFLELKASKDRTQMGAPAPAQGLLLAEVRYPKGLEEACQPLPKKISH